MNTTTTSNNYNNSKSFFDPANSSKDIIASLDIGTTKICALIARVGEDGVLDVLGVGTADSKGIMRGVINNVSEAINSIKAAVSQAELQSGMRISRVVVGIAGQHIKCFKHRNYLTREIDNFITISDIEDLVNQVRRIVLPSGEKIIHVLPVTYKVNNDEGIINPIGMRCTSLEGDFLIVTGNKDSIENIKKCVEEAGLQIAELVLEPIASSIAVLNDREKDAGVALVDIGGGTTDVAIFFDGIIRHTAVIPFGGSIITQDVIDGCEVMKDDAELLKINHGSSLVLEKFENVIISIPDRFSDGNGEPSKVSMKNLALIIHARVEEILEEVYNHIRESEFDSKLRAGVVLTGGGSLLSNIDEHCRYLCGMRSRKGGVAHRLKNKSTKVNSPKFATAVGLIVKGNELVKIGELDSNFVSLNETEESNKGTIIERPVDDGFMKPSLVKDEAPKEKPGVVERLFTKMERLFTNQKKDSPDFNNDDEDF